MAPPRSRHIDTCSQLLVLATATGRPTMIESRLTPTHRVHITLFIACEHSAFDAMTVQFNSRFTASHSVYTVSEKCTKFETEYLEIIEIDFHNIWQKYSK